MTVESNVAVAHRAAVSRMMIYFAIVYIAEGWAQTSGIIKQPLLKYLHETLQWSGDDIGGYMWWLGIPWWIKPIYGMLSDSLPIAGFRRKSYLVLCSLVAMFCYMGLRVSSSPGPMLAALIGITMSMAFCSALCGALIVEQSKVAHQENDDWRTLLRSNLITIAGAALAGWLFQYFLPLDVMGNSNFLRTGGLMLLALLICSAAITVGTAYRHQHGKHSGVASKFCGQQSLWANVAGVLAAFFGGWLAQQYVPLQALHTAALWAAAAPLVVLLVTWPLVKEEKASTDMAHFKQGCSAIYRALCTKEIWAVLGFLVLWAFNPGFGDVLYLHMKDNLHFSDLFIGELNGFFAIGAACGALLYMRVISKFFAVKTLACFVIVVGAAVQASFIWLGNPTLAVGLEFAWGALTAMAAVNAHVIAANRCPDHAEGFLYAGLLAASNLSWSTSGWLGGWLYTNKFHNDDFWLILMSAGLTLACFFVLRKLDVSRVDPTQPSH